MVKLQSLILVHFVEQQLEGWTFERAHWPLHITLVPWFAVDDDEAVFRSIERVAESTRSVRLDVGGEAKFGAQQNVPVNIISTPGPVHALHEVLVATLEETDISFHEENYMRKQFVPHITQYPHDNRRSNEGERVDLNEIQLVRLVDETTCRIEKAFKLQ